MAVTFDILVDIGIIYIQYTGFTPLEDSIASARARVRHPDFKSVMPHYVDVSAVTRPHKDHVVHLAFQAEMAEIYSSAAGDHMSVFNAPEGPGRIIAERAYNAWGSSPHMHIRIADSHEMALDILNITPERFERSLATLRNSLS